MHRIRLRHSYLGAIGILAAKQRKPNAGSFLRSSHLPAAASSPTPTYERVTRTDNGTNRACKLPFCRDGLPIAVLMAARVGQKGSYGPDVLIKVGEVER